MCVGRREREWYVDRQVTDRRRDKTVLTPDKLSTNSSTSRVHSLIPPFPFLSEIVSFCSCFYACSHFPREDFRDAGRCPGSVTPGLWGAPPAPLPASWHCPSPSLSLGREPRGGAPVFGCRQAPKLLMERREKAVKEVKSICLEFW